MGWLDILTRVLPAMLGAIVGALVALWGAQRLDEKQQFDFAVVCFPMVERMVDRFQDKPVQIREIENRIDLLPLECKVNRQTMLNLVRMVAEVRETLPEGASQARPEAIAGDPLRLPQRQAGGILPGGILPGGPMGSAQMEGVAPSKGQGAEAPAGAASGPLSGWVALGFLSANASYGDVNFVWATSGQPITANPKEGALLRAKWKVDVRPKVGKWDQVSGVLDIGQCFEVEKSQDVPAGSQAQAWVKGRAVSCPAGTSR